MRPVIQIRDKDFLEQSLKFYRNIHKYSALLEIAPEDIEAFKNDVKVLLFVSNKRYRPFTESFVSYNIAILRTRLERLFNACTNSKTYTKKIGTDLGIISPWYRIALPLSWSAFDISPDLLINPLNQ